MAQVVDPGSLANVQTGQEFEVSRRDSEGGGSLDVDGFCLNGF